MSGDEEMEVADEKHEATEAKKLKKLAKKEKYREQQLKTLPALDETVKGRRGEVAKLM